MEGLDMYKRLYLIMNLFHSRKSKKEYEKVFSDMNTAAKTIISRSR